MSRKGGTGRGGWVHLKGTDSVDVSGLSFRKALFGSLCGPFFSIYAQCQCLVGAPILAFKVFHSLDRNLVETIDCCNPVNEWVTDLHRIAARALM